jgi:SAM-dependent methyltransferase
MTGGIRADFLPLLACPRCHSRFTFHAGSGSSPKQGTVECASGHTYPVVSGVPRFVASDGYASNFGFEWNIHRRTQLDDQYSHESETTLVAKTGFTSADLKGKLVLDVGCGMGRFSDVVSRWGGRVVGIDLTSAVDAANANIGDRPNVHLAQADVFRLPFDDGVFDYIFSIGVLHHTPNSRRAFDCLPRLLKPGGKVAIWLYSRRMKRWSWISDLYRLVTTRLPKETLYSWSHIADPLYGLHKRLETRSHFLDGLLGRALPTSRHERPEVRVLDTFDWYSPRYQWKHSEAEVRVWFQAHGLVDLIALEVETSLQGTKPN